jgi:hypothetical protein
MRVKEESSYFVHEKRIIWYQEYYVTTDEQMSLFLFLDESLKVKEEKDYLERIQTHPEEYSLEEFHLRKDTFGTIALLTNLQDRESEDVYQTYKSRMTI